MISGNCCDNYDFEDATAEILALFERRECLKERPAETERWKPEKGEEYWFIDLIGDLVRHFWNDRFSENFMWTNGNCFKTREQAEQAREKMKEVLLTFHNDQGTQKNKTIPTA